MADFKPTPAQQQAISDRDRNIIVSASAGSGKTAVLVNRAVALIKEGRATVDRMLLVTFTDAAAKNMRDKIRQRLQEVAQAEPRLRDLMNEQVNRLAVADISTIHAFCLKLIKRYYFLIGLDPQFRLLTDDTERLLLQEDVLRQVNEQFYAVADEESDNAASFGQLVLNFSSDRDDQGLNDLVLKLMEIANAQPNPEQWLAQLPTSYQLNGPVLASTFYRDQLRPLVLQQLAQLQHDFAELAQRADQEGLSKAREVLADDQAVLTRLQAALDPANLDGDQLQAILGGVTFGSFSGRPQKGAAGYDEFKVLNQERNQLKKKWPAVAATVADKETALARLDQFSARFQELRDRAAAAQLDGKTLASLDKDLQQFTQARRLLVPDTWNAVRAIIRGAKFRTMAGKPKGDPVAAEVYATLTASRQALKKQLTGIQDSYFAYDEDQFQEISHQSQRLLTKLSQVTVAFRRAYQQVKLSRHVLEFSDLEHYAYQILTPPTDQPDWQELVANLQRHYQEIMVDEYQDTNRLQEAILTRLTNPDQHNLFMVGDVKQSIYRFRQADPSLFLHKYRRYQQPGVGDEAIVLGENFRSMSNVTDFTNLLFAQLMGADVGEIEYDQAAHLKYAATYYETADNQPQPTEVMLYDANADRDAIKESPDQHEDDKLAGELKMVGMRIKQMVANEERIFDPATKQLRPVNYGDIVLLERTKSINNTLMKEFSKLEIPLTVHDVESYFQATEVRVMMALLRLIDNPHQDIPLVAVLRSPLVGLSTKELAFIRLQNRTADYYGALQSFKSNYANADRHLIKPELLNATATDDQPDPVAALYDKVSHFLDQLATFRQTAQQQSLVDLIWQIYNETGYLDYVGAMPGGAQRQANLHAFYQRAHDYEQSSFKGLYQFIRFIEKMQEHDKDLGVAPTQLVKNTVNVMTIHGSKGLQFPIVFLIDATHGFNQQATRDTAVVDAVNKVGIEYIDQEHVRYDTPQRQAIINAVQQGERAEDLRVLYVALTRAEQRLVITGSFNEENRRQNLASAWARWQKAFQSPAILLGPQLRVTARSFMDWIGLALARSAAFRAKQVAPAGMELDESAMADYQHYQSLFTGQRFTVASYTAADVAQQLAGLQAQQAAPVVTDQTAIDQQELARIKQLLGARYPYPVATKTTAYQSVTDVKRLFEYPDNAVEAQWDYEQQQREKQAQGIYFNQHFAEPAFIKQADEQPAATTIGTATHLVFQKLPLTAGPVTPASVQAEVQRLVDQGLLTPAVAAKINVTGVAGFFQTAVGQQILAAPEHYHREEPFAMVMNGAELFKEIKTSNNEQVLLHGIIDGYLETPTGIILVDYKTDHLRPGFGVAEIVARYRGQLNLYQEALSLMKPLPVVQKGLYLVESEQFITI
ncbi:helicase-exonuclease AddAB subunit AddA [Limosilactobacillus antri]|uniref:helicase-exonuclease AddAB subunit AddA n=1 Tax=Limosilactobacillus antri TaxID=227943 RepID=UPI001F55DB99|nr:helicase-exonuclease AddAB subunit AddA [Limosilactobacillus antri]